MRRRLPTLRSRLVGSYAVVIATGLLTLGVAVRLLDPYLLGHHFGAGPGGGTVGTRHEGLYRALDWSLLIASAASLLVAALVAGMATRRILRPLDAVRTAARHLAEGNFGETVELPRERELAALAEDVNHLAAALAATERQRTRLISDLAHELRTPLATLRALLEGALDGVLDLDDEMLASLLEEASRLERLAGDLAEVSRAEEGALRLAPRRVALDELARRAAERLRPQFDDKGVALVVEAGRPPPVLADPDRVTQVVTNLLGNALRATPAGGRVHVAAGPGGDGARIEVVDTGAGIAPEHLPRVFDRFWRGPETEGNGNGIGLTIARAIAEAHGGSLTAASDGLGRGARFVLELPQAPGGPATGTARDDNGRGRTPVGEGTPGSPRAR